MQSKFFKKCPLMCIYIHFINFKICSVQLLFLLFLIYSYSKINFQEAKNPTLCLTLPPNSYQKCTLHIHMVKSYHKPLNMKISIYEHPQSPKNCELSILTTKSSNQNCQIIQSHLTEALISTSWKKWVAVNNKPTQI